MWPSFQGLLHFLGRLLKSSVFVVQKVTDPKNGLRFRHRSIGANRSSLGTSHWRNPLWYYIPTLNWKHFPFTLRIISPNPLEKISHSYWHIFPFLLGKHESFKGKALFKRAGKGKLFLDDYPQILKNIHLLGGSHINTVLNNPHNPLL